MVKREFLMQAHKYNPKKTVPNGWYLSEKLDGFRCFWDGGVSRSIPKDEVPWANTNKDERFVNKVIATGLWSRYANVIHAPDSFLDSLPEGVLLDGELWMGRRLFQSAASIVRRLSASDNAWSKIYYKVFDSPHPESVFADGKIDSTHCKMTVKGAVDWVRRKLRPACFTKGVGFDVRQAWLTTICPELLHEQICLPYNTQRTLELIDAKLEEILELGGEGIMLRKATSTWVTNRSWNLLKLKPYHDDEAVVIGFTTGRKTDLGSKLLGRIGALIVKYKDKTFELSGLTHEEREFSNERSRSWAEENPGQECPTWIQSKYFKKGTKVTFRYRELSDEGIPKDARFLRIHVCPGS